jgi:hypothetical protein
LKNNVILSGDSNAENSNLRNPRQITGGIKVSNEVIRLPASNPEQMPLLSQQKNAPTISPITTPVIPAPLIPNYPPSLPPPVTLTNTQIMKLFLLFVQAVLILFQFQQTQ